MEGVDSRLVSESPARARIRATKFRDGSSSRPSPRVRPSAIAAAPEASDEIGVVEPAKLVTSAGLSFGVPSMIHCTPSSLEASIETSAMMASMCTWARGMSSCWITERRERNTDMGAVITRALDTWSAWMLRLLPAATPLPPTFFDWALTTSLPTLPRILAMFSASA